MSPRAWTAEQLAEIRATVAKLSYRQRQQLARFHEGGPIFNMHRRTGDSLIRRDLLTRMSRRVVEQVFSSAAGDRVEDLGDQWFWLHEYWVAGAAAYNVAVWLHETPEVNWP